MKERLPIYKLISFLLLFLELFGISFLIHKKKIFLPDV